MMVSATLVCAACLAASPALDSSANDLANYESARAAVGRDPQAHIKLALWCEAHGLRAERIKHLAIAVLTDPTNATARGLMGLVAYRGRWKSPEDVATAARDDAALQATYAEYNARREQMMNTADEHWKLGLWCEQNGLKAEAMAHFTAVTRLNPNHADAWHRLGCKKYGGRWLSEAQVAAERAEADAQHQADAHWGPRLKQWWKDWLAHPDRRSEAESTIGEALEARAVPTIRTLFAEGSPEQQLAAVQLYGRIDSPEATRELARLATVSRSWDVRTKARDTLVGRDPNEVVEPLVGFMRQPMSVNVFSAPGQNAVSEIDVEDENAILRKLYVQRTVRVAPAPRGANFGFMAPIFGTRSSNRTAGQQMSRDLRTVQRRNANRQMVNESARSVLTDLTGQDLGSDPESWRKWLADQKGYAYVTPTSPSKQVITRVSQHVSFTSSGFHHNCFAKGTPVRTLLGLKPIETLRVGDQVLSEDPASGALSFQPVVVVYHNPPSPTLRIRLNDDEVIATPIHRFWRAGKGWVLARELRSGDSVRVLGGLSKVVSSESDVVQPVFNLEVASGHSFFVGRQGALVHDNSRLEPASAPFDAVAVAPAGVEPAPRR